MIFRFSDRAKLFKASSSVAKHYPEAIPARTSSTMFQRVMNDFEQRVSALDMHDVTCL